MDPHATTFISSKCVNPTLPQATPAYINHSSQTPPVEDLQPSISVPPSPLVAPNTALNHDAPPFIPARPFGPVSENPPMLAPIHGKIVALAKFFATAPAATPLSDLKRKIKTIPFLSPCRFSEALSIAVEHSHHGDRGGYDAVKFFDMARGSKWIHSVHARLLFISSFAACAHVSLDYDGQRTATVVNKNSTRQLVYNKNGLPSDPIPEYATSATKLLNVISHEVQEKLYLGPFTREEAEKKFGIFISSSIFGIEDLSRSTTKIRLIHNLSSSFFSVNNFVETEFTHTLDYTKLFFEALHNVANLSPSVWFACLDISRGYRRFRVRHQDIPLQGLSVPITTTTTVPSFDGTTSGVRQLLQGAEYFYFDTAMPFGARSAPQNFCTVSIAIRDLVRELAANGSIPGYLLTYVDDFSALAPTEADASYFLDTLRAILTEVNLPENPSKAQPSSLMTQYLGLEYDGVKLTATLPKLKRQLYIKYLQYFIDTRRIKWSDLNSLVHRLRHAASVLRAGKPFFSNLLVKLKSSKANANHYVTLSDRDRDDIRWWLHLLRHHKPQVVIGPSHWSSLESVGLYTDASKRGFGAYFTFNGSYFNGPFTPLEIAAFESNQVSIAEFELVVLCFAISTWGHLLAGKRLTFYCDNLPSVYSVNSQSSTIIVRVALLRHLFAIAAIHSIDVQSIWLGTKTNIIADSLSRFDMKTFHRLTKNVHTKQHQHPILTSRALLLTPDGRENPSNPEWRP